MIVDGRKRSFKPSTETIKKLCSINEGIGAEQLLVIEPSVMTGARARIRIYNFDGNEVEACGNATRCVAKLLMDTEQIQSLSLEIADRIIPCKLMGDLVQVDMGNVSFNWQKIPMAEPTGNFYPGYETLAANVGNPHIVIFVPSLDDISADERITIGRTIQQHQALIESANVGFAEIVDQNTVKLQVFERPGILTLACGSGACAAVALAVSRGYVHPKNVTVMMPGGNLIIECDEQYNVKMTGTADYCYEGMFQEENYA